MHRAVPVLAATGGALVLLANFHTSPASTGAIGTSGETDGPTSTEAALSSAASTTVLAASTTVPRSTTTSTAPANGDTRTLDGPVATNEWGDVQVRVTLTRTRIVGVQALRLPNDNSHSAALSRASEPILRKEALQAQSAQIDLVSGATLTSESYIESLQGALDQR